MNQQIDDWRDGYKSGLERAMEIVFLFSGNNTTADMIYDLLKKETAPEITITIGSE